MFDNTFQSVCTRFYSLVILRNLHRVHQKLYFNIFPHSLSIIFRFLRLKNWATNASSQRVNDYLQNLCLKNYQFFLVFEWFSKTQNWTRNDFVPREWGTVFTKETFETEKKINKIYSFISITHWQVSGFWLSLIEHKHGTFSFSLTALCFDS